MTAALLAILLTPAADPCVSGPKVGQRPGPYSFVMCTGEQRGKSHCYICETEDKPAVIVFARSLSEPLGKLTAAIDKSVATYKKNNLRAWVTILHDDQSKIDSDVLAWVKKHSLKSPVGVFEDTDGPPSYKLHRDADVTVLVFVKQKVVVNRAFRINELKDKQIEQILADIPKATGPVQK